MTRMAVKIRMERTKRVMAIEYKTSMRRNLKKCVASSARPAIQYVLRPISTCRVGHGEGSYIVATIMVGIILIGTISNTSRDSNQAVELRGRGIMKVCIGTEARR